MGQVFQQDLFQLLARGKNAPRNGGQYFGAAQSLRGLGMALVFVRRQFSTMAARCFTGSRSSADCTRREVHREIRRPDCFPQQLPPPIWHEYRRGDFHDDASPGLN